MSKELEKEIELIKNKTVFTKLEKDNYYRISAHQLEMFEQALTPPTDFTKGR